MGNSAFEVMASTPARQSTPHGPEPSTGELCLRDGAVADLSVSAWPPVTVVMPVKGCRRHSADNWDSHLSVQYGGPIEFIFVVESEADPACRAVQELKLRHPHAAIRLVVAGLASTCSQKAHNLCAGIEACGSFSTAGSSPACDPCSVISGSGITSKPFDAASPGAGCCCTLVSPVPCSAVSGSSGSTCVDAFCALKDGDASTCRISAVCGPIGDHGGPVSAGPMGRKSGYVLCLDDDVALHPGSVADLVAELEQNKDVFMATGYPFDIPPPGSSFCAYLALSYHLPLLIAFSVSARTAFVWGGCMLLRREALLPGDPYGVLEAWRRGGYSDDLILASLCTERGLGIRAPPFAIFPQRLDPRMGLRAWLNYLHRQLFVLDTYANDHNRVTNHTMMVLHSLLSWLLVLPSLAALAHLLRAALAPLLLAALRAALPLAQLLAAAVRTDSLPAAHHPAPIDEGLSAPSGLLASPGADMAAAGSAALAHSWGRCLGQVPGGAWAVMVGWLAAHAALLFMTGEVLALFRVLSRGSPAAPIRLSCFSWWRLWAAMLMSNALLPLVMLYAYAVAEVNWGGTTYRKRRGKVAPVRRCDAAPLEEGDGGRGSVDGRRAGRRSVESSAGAVDAAAAGPARRRRGITAHARLSRGP